MFPTITTKLLSAEEFSLLPDSPGGELQELVNGVIVTMPPPRGRHGACCLAIGSAIHQFVRSAKLGHAVSNDTGFVLSRNPDTIRGPDIAFWRFDRLAELPDDYIPIPPDLAVEVVSPSDHFTHLQGKIRQYLECGVALLWVVDPIDRSVSVYRPNAPLRILLESETLSGEDVLPGFSLTVGDLFT